MKDPRDPLSSTLHTWRHEPAPAPDFNDQVWARIHAADTANASTPDGAAPLASSLAAPHAPATSLRFPHAFPLAASLAVLLSLAAGAGTAFALNHTRTTERMATAYVRSIDPVQLTASNATGAHAAHLHP